MKRLLLMCLCSTAALSLVASDTLSPFNQLKNSVQNGQDITYEQVCDVFQQDIDRAAHDIAVFSCTFTLYKKKNNYNHTLWREIIQLVSQFLREPTREEYLRRLADIVCFSNIEEHGLQESVNITFDSGECLESCGKDCACLTRNEGTCLCALNGCDTGCGQGCCQ